VTIHVNSRSRRCTPARPPSPRPIAVERRPTATSRSARPQQRADPGERDELPASATSPSPTSTKRSTSLDPKTTQGPAGVQSRDPPPEQVRRAGPVAHRRDRTLRAVADRDRPLLLRARARPDDVHEVPRRNAKAVTTIGARKDQLAGADRTRRHDLTPSANSRRTLARGSKNCRSRCARAIARSPNCRTFSALERLVNASKPTVQPLSRLSAAGTAAEDRDAGRHELLPGVQPAGRTTT